MNADLAQRISLVAHGNAFVSGLVDRPPDLLAENSAFQHVRSVEFRMRGRSIHGVDLWFSALARRGARRLWMRRNDLAIEGDGVEEVWLPSGVFISKRFEERQDRQLRTFADSGVWNEDEQIAISSILARTERPWRLYFTQESRKSRPRRGTSVPAARAALAEAVTEAQAFSRHHGIGYVDTFGRALSLLGSRNPSAPYHPDMLPSVGYSLDARRVLAAAAQAFVFGGMGSWGDIHFEDESVEAAFWPLNTKLQLEVEDALIAAANSFDGSPVGRETV